MGGRNGYPDFSNANAFEFAAYLEALEEWADEKINDTVPNAAALPASGNIVGRLITAEDTGALYVCTALPGVWKKTTDVDDTGWITPTTEFAAGWSQFSDAVWSGFRYRRKNGLMVAVGAVNKTGSYTALDTMLTFPPGFRPVVPTLSGASSSGVYAVAKPDGTVLVSTNGSGRIPISLTYFV